MENRSAEMKVLMYFYWRLEGISFFFCKIKVYLNFDELETAVQEYDHSYVNMY